MTTRFAVNLHAIDGQQALINDTLLQHFYCMATHIGENCQRNIYRIWVIQDT